jgi:hypothetical protein
MKKQIVAIIGAVVVVLAIATGLVWWQASQQNNTANTGGPDQNNTSFAGAKDACNYLTAAIAAKLLGEGSAKSDGGSPVTTEDLSVSTCIYTSKPGETIADVKNMRSLTLLVRSPLTAVGAASNDEPFDSLKTGAIKVDGYGEKAFWDPELGQLNVLKGGTWLILSSGKTSLIESTLDDAKKLADEIVPQF